MYGGLRKEGGLGVKASPPMGRSKSRPSTAEAKCRSGPPPPSYPLSVHSCWTPRSQQSGGPLNKSTV